MLRRSFALFAILAIVCLALVVGYAMLGLSGPATAVADAESAIAAGRPNDAVRLLNVAEKSASLQADVELKRKLYRLRYEAHKSLGNASRALQDMAILQSMGAQQDPGINVEFIEVELRAGQPEKAMAQVEALLAEDPNNGRLLQLRGEARQLMYQTRVADLVDTLERELAGTARDEALRAMRDFLYRPDEDPRVRLGRDSVMGILVAQGAATRNTTFEPLLVDTRSEVQLCLEDYRAALETDTLPTSAYQGMAHALREGGRHDDLICLAEIYLARFDHIYTTRAAVDLVQAHLAQGRPQAAVDAAERFLENPNGDGWQQRMKEDRLDRDVRFLLLDKLIAHQMLGQKTQSRQTVTIARQIHRLLGLHPEMPLMIGLHKRTLGDDMDSASFFKGYIKGLPRGVAEVVPVTGTDWVSRAMEELVQVAPEEERLEAHKDWIRLRADYAAPWAARATYRLAIDEFLAAHEDAKQAFERAPTDESVLQLLARAAEKNYESIGQDGEGLLRDCLKEGSTKADTPDPIGYLLCARAAKQNREWEIMLHCAEAASVNWQWALEPRLLYAEAATQLDRAHDAIDKLQSARRYHGDNPRLLFAMRQAAGAQVRGIGEAVPHLLVDTMRTIPAAPMALEDLIKQTLDHGPASALPLLAKRALEFDNSTPTLLAAAAQAAARGNDLATAESLVQRLEEANAPYKLQLPAKAELLLASISTDTDRGLTKQAARLLPLAQDRPSELVGIAKNLAAGDRPLAAFTLLRAVLNQGESDQRNGTTYALAGRLALELENYGAAREYLTAAVSFEDGGDAAIPLAYLFVDLGDETNAVLATELRGPEHPMPTPLLWRLGKVRAAVGQAVSRLRNDRDDLVSQAVIAVEQTESCPDEELRQIATEHPQKVMEAVLWLERSGFSSQALAAAQALAEAAPDTTFPQLILARALAARGQVQPATQILVKLGASVTVPWSVHQTAAHIVATGDPTVLPPQLQKLLLAGYGEPEGVITPEHTVVASRLMAAQTIQGGFVDATLEAFLAAWRKYPNESQVRIPDITQLRLKNRSREALEILSLMEPGLPPAQRGSWLGEFFLAAGQLALAPTEGQQPDRVVRELARDRANRIIQTEGHWAAAVQYLVMEEEDRLGSLREDRGNDSRLRRDRHLRWANGIIDFHLDGTTQPERGLDWAIDMIKQLTNSATAAARVEELLEMQPASANLWYQRTLLAEQLGRTEQAVDDLRTVFDYLPDLDLAINRAVIAGASARQAPRDLADLNRTSTNVRDRPDVRLGLGLLNLRMANYQSAADLLSGARPWGSGARDYFRAMALVCVGGAENLETAARLFNTVAVDYPGEARLANAEHFAAQLRASN